MVLSIGLVSILFFLFLINNWWIEHATNTLLVESCLLIINLITLGLLIDSFIRMRNYEA